MHRLLTVVVLALVTVLSAKGEVSSKKKVVESVAVDSLTLLVQAGDSLMQQYNTFEALKYYRLAYQMAKERAATQARDTLRLPIEQLERLPQEKADEIIERLKADAERSAIVSCPVQMKLADCYYKRADYRQCSELLKLIPEDSLTHEAFRQLAFSYQKQNDPQSLIYWGGRLLEHYPMDGEIVAAVTTALTRTDQAWSGINYAKGYFETDSTNILVNRAFADAYFMDRQFDKSVAMYERLLQQGDSTFNTLYSAGMCYSQLDSLELAYEHLKPAFFLSQMQNANCAYRLGVVCVDTQRFDEGLRYLDLATQLLLPDTTVMKAITLSKGEAYYLSFRHAKAVEAWKEHLKYNPNSIATYYNIASATYYYLPDSKQAKSYFEKFLEMARKEQNPNAQLKEMMEKAESLLRTTAWGDGKPKPKSKVR
jgi:tetratricopeptide (TPR) repeat protein